MYGVPANHYVLETGQGLTLGRAGTPLNGCASPQLTRSSWKKERKPYRLIAALDPAFPNQQVDLADFQWPSTSRVGRQGETEREVKAGAKEKWSKHNESALSGDTPLPLPLAYPGTEPLTQRQIDAMMSCDPEVEVKFSLLTSQCFCSILPKLPRLFLTVRTNPANSSFPKANASI